MQALALSEPAKRERIKATSLRTSKRNKIFLIYIKDRLIILMIMIMAGPCSKGAICSQRRHCAYGPQPQPHSSATRAHGGAHLSDAHTRVAEATSTRRRPAGNLLDLRGSFLPPARVVNNNPCDAGPVQKRLQHRPDGRPHSLSSRFERTEPSFVAHARPSPPPPTGHMSLPCVQSARVASAHRANQSGVATILHSCLPHPHRQAVLSNQRNALHSDYDVAQARPCSAPSYTFNVQPLEREWPAPTV